MLQNLHLLILNCSFVKLSLETIIRSSEFLWLQLRRTEGVAAVLLFCLVFPLKSIYHNAAEQCVQYVVCSLLYLLLLIETKQTA